MGKNAVIIDKDAFIEEEEEEEEEEGDAYDGGWAALWAIRSRPALLQWIEIDMQNEQGETLLHHACLFKYHDIVAILLYEGASVHLQNKKGEIALHVACKLGNLHVVRALLDHGSNPNHKDSEGQSPLFHATAFGHGAIVEILLDAQRELLTVST